MNDRDDLSGAYALNALDAAETLAYEEHLARSESARNEATELGDTAVMLGLAVDPVDPPASLRASILAQIAVTPQLPAATTQDAPTFGPAETKARARWFAKPVNAIIGVAAAVALIIGGGVAVQAISSGVTQQQAADQLAAIQSADDAQSVKAQVTSGGTATLVYAASLESSALIVDGMTALPADKVYELWYINGDGARPAGTFTVGSDGKMWQVLDGTMQKGDTVGVTVEPHGGSETPTTDPVLVVATA